jgi:hypothetical protein
MLRIISSGLRLMFSRPGRAWLLLRVAFWLAVFSSAVKILSLPRALSLISPSPNPHPDSGGNEDLTTAVDAVLGLDFFVFRPICWKRAALLHRFLAQRGVSTTISFGVRKGANKDIDGHAWLESAGRPIFEKEPPNYRVTYVFPSNAPFDMELSSIAEKPSRSRTL